MSCFMIWVLSKQQTHRCSRYFKALHSHQFGRGYNKKSPRAQQGLCVFYTDDIMRLVLCNFFCIICQSPTNFAGGIIKKALAHSKGFVYFKKKGGDLLSHQLAVPSALKGLTSLFGMVRGVTPSL